MLRAGRGRTLCRPNSAPTINKRFPSLRIRLDRSQMCLLSAQKIGPCVSSAFAIWVFKRTLDAVCFDAKKLSRFSQLSLRRYGNGLLSRFLFEDFLKLLRILCQSNNIAPFIPVGFLWYNKTPFYCSLLTDC